jgi:hypothetical protein
MDPDYQYVLFLDNGKPVWPQTSGKRGNRAKSGSVAGHDGHRVRLGTNRQRNNHLSNGPNGGDYGVNYGVQVYGKFLAVFPRGRP